ncbi:ABC transporter substrate-binding protein [Pararhodobacter aggregans]|uniref:ABC transporter permease n=1 Tax=Pararhodobacter aggregans TaxID=404875 RepID=A0A2T7US98_9RHOB|nr:ABC transporter substrate-binding protein [Pararhodobacter aggregans]PTX00140.1 amino acid/amide ABC transporter substrate-binding protein (HAAT family) [Pararhodobacter aggregans]PVE47468.1 ABC transporter permease [Pararhodobacter aggregans]
MTLTKTGALALMMTCTALTAAPAWADFTDGVIRIGVMNDQSGPYADNCGAGSVTMARLAIEDHGGAINGVPVELVIADDQNQPDIGVSTARRWVEEEGVDAIVGCSASSIALAVQDVMRQHERPYLIAGTATTETTNSQCSPMTTNWAYDTYTLARGSVNAQIEQGNLRWYFITVDYTFGHAWQADATRFIEAAGGEVLGSTLHPLGATDFSSQLLQAQASGAQVIGIANAGADLANVIKQAEEFGIVAAGQHLAPLGILTNNIHGIGLEATQGLVFSAAAYWNYYDASRALTERYNAAFDGRYPNEAQLVTYSAVNHYLEALSALGSDEGVAVMDQMRATPVNDPLMQDVSIREDGVVMHPMIMVQVKSPAESTGPWDYYNVLGLIPAEQSWRSREESSCALFTQ